jgi:hypothetical protein
MTTARAVTANLVLGFSLAFASTANGGERSPLHHVVTRNGWKVVGYGTAAVSVPRSWAVLYDQNCPDLGFPGTVIVGLPTLFEVCPYYPLTTEMVILTSAPSGNLDRYIESTREMNGTKVDLLSGSSMTTWYIPSFGVQVMGEGKLASSVLRTVGRLRGRADWDRGAALSSISC